MSAEQSRLRSAIQRIAKEDPELRGAIEAAKSRGDQPGGTGVGESNAERDRICCDGSTSDNANPGSDTRDPSESAKDGLNPDDPADISDNLTGVVDCATGQPICFEGGDWIPPEGWEDPSDPPLAEGFIEGEYWVYSFEQTGDETTLVTGSSPSCSTAVSVGTSALSSCCDAAFRISQSGCDRDIHSGNFSCGAACSVSGRGIWSIERVFCDDASDPAYCEPDSPPKEQFWTPDGCVNLAIIGGSIVSSKYDPENDGSYSAPRDEIELCDPENGTRTLVRADTGSTWKSIKSLDGDIDPNTGYGYLYDTASGKKIRQISPSEFRDDTV